jgi:hypothetical protein
MALRSAEKSRVSSCAAADEIAKAVIGKYKELTSGKCESQIVLAGIVAVREPDFLQVVSIGVGNKFEPTGKKDPNRVRDCHAEILARRAFKRWLIEEYASVSDGGESDFFQVVNDIRGSVCMSVKDGVQWALYVSSAPCGNACVRRWGDSPKETFHEDLKRLEFFDDRPHPPFHPHSQSEGQTAVTFKGGSTILSCSDKILRWNVLGLQGRKLSAIVESNIYLHAIIVGRKFVRKHAHRAFCCRFSSKKIDKLIQQSVHHPCMLCTAVKLDDGGLDAEIGACFTERVLWWHASLDKAEFIDGASGLTVNGEPSALSSSQFEQECRDIPQPKNEILFLVERLVEQLTKL